MGDLIAPAEGHVGPAVDEEDGVYEFAGGRLGVEVIVCMAIEIGGFVLDSWVVRGYFVDHLDYEI